jgi:phosphoadenosine phosphosulfate reductase
MTALRPNAEMDTQEIRELSAWLESQPLEDVLGWCWENFGAQAAIGTSLQGAGLVILHHASRLGLPFPVFTVDTGLLFPETLALIDEISQRLGIEIERLRPEQSVAAQAAEFGPELWKRSPDLCCTMRKVAPLQKKLAQLSVWITGLRRQQSSTRAQIEVLERYEFDMLRDGHIYKLNPLAGWTRDRVRAYIAEHRLPYNPLKDRGYGSIGCMTCTLPVGSNDDDRAGRWTGFDKSECGIHTFLGDNI